MKKMTSIIATIMLAIGLAACGSNKEQTAVDAGRSIGGRDRILD